MKNPKIARLITFCLLLTIKQTGFAQFPRISVNYPEIGNSLLDREFVRHWQMGSEMLRRDMQKFIDRHPNQDPATERAWLREIGANCESSNRTGCSYTGIVDYRLSGTPNAEDEEKTVSSTFLIHFDINTESVLVTVVRDDH